MKNNTVKKGLMPYVIMFIFIIGCLFIINNMKNKVNEFTYDEFNDNLKDGKITEMTITPKTRTEVYQIVGKLEGYGTFKCSSEANKWKSVHCMNFTKAMLDVLYDSAKKAGNPSAVFEDTGVANLLYRMLINAIGTLADPFNKDNEQMMLGVMFAFLSLYSVTR